MYAANQEQLKTARRRALRHEAGNCLKLASLCVVLAIMTNGWISIMGGDPTPALTMVAFKVDLTIAVLGIGIGALLFALSSSEVFLRLSVRKARG